MISFRKIEEKDRAFIEKVYRSTREDELIRTNWTELQKQGFIIMQSIAQENDYRNKYPRASFDIILFRKQPAGRLYLFESETHILIIDISLLPNFQGKNIGSTILKELAGKARKKNKILSLNVREENRALKLYLRMGFKKISTTNEYIYMELNS